MVLYTKRAQMSGAPSPVMHPEESHLLHRVSRFHESPKIFTLAGSLRQRVILDPIQYWAPLPLARFPFMAVSSGCTQSKAFSAGALLQKNRWTGYETATMFQFHRGGAMTVMTRSREALLERLIALAGDPLIVQTALRELNAQLPGPPNVEQLVRRVLELKHRAQQSEAIATIL